MKLQYKAINPQGQKQTNDDLNRIYEADYTWNKGTFGAVIDEEYDESGNLLYYVYYVAATFKKAYWSKHTDEYGYRIEFPLWYEGSDEDQEARTLEEAIKGCEEHVDWLIGDHRKKPQVEEAPKAQAAPEKEENAEQAAKEEQAKAPALETPPHDTNLKSIEVVKAIKTAIDSEIDGWNESAHAYGDDANKLDRDAFWKAYTENHDMEEHIWLATGGDTEHESGAMESESCGYFEGILNALTIIGGREVFKKIEEMYNEWDERMSGLCGYKFPWRFEDIGNNIEADAHYHQLVDSLDKWSWQGLKDLEFALEEWRKAA